MINRWGKIAWNGLIMGKGKQLMHYWKQLKSNGQNEVRERHTIKGGENKNVNEGGNRGMNLVGIRYQKIIPVIDLD